MEFRPGQNLRAADLSALSRSADAAHLGAAGYLASDNGSELVVRNPRREARGGGAVRSGAVPARITGEEGGVYTADLFADGLDRPRTARAKLTLMCHSTIARVPSGTVVLAFPVAAEIVETALADDPAEEGEGEGGEGSGGEGEGSGSAGGEGGESQAEGGEGS